MTKEETFKKVRFSDYDLECLKNTFATHFLEKDRLWIFGSRADLTKKGGDIDLYIETYAENANDALKRRGDFIWDLEQKIGEQKIDIVINMINYPYPLPIHEIAKTKGVRII